MQTVGPRDCGLAIALPLTRERFLQHLRMPEWHDYAAYVRDLSKTAGAADEYYWTFEYEHFAAAMSTRCSQVERQGVRVVRDATPGTLAALFVSCAVVTIVAHSRFEPLRPEEILDMQRLLTMLRHPPSRLVEAFRRQLDTLQPLWSTQASVPARLVEAINRVLAAAHESYRDEARAPVLLLDIPAVRLTRPTLERAFEGVIAAGKTVELADGMKTIREIAAIIPPSFGGLVDLTICNSAIMGESIKELRPECVVAVNRYQTAPHVRLAIYRLAIDDLARHRQPFANAMARFAGTGKGG
jgi:hypothetical protein